MSQGEASLLRGERRVLEMVATGASLRETLEALIALIEAQEPGLRCGVLVVSADGAYFSRSYGPSLPEAYHDALAGLPISPPYVGACAEAAHLGVSVAATDVADDARYSDRWRELLAECGLASIRSTPITGPDGAPLGSFAMYRDRPGGPLPDPRLAGIAAHLASIALERARFREATRARDARLSAAAEQFASLVENAPFGTYVIDAGFRVAQASQIARRTFGFDGLIGTDLGDALRRIWPDPFASEAIASFRRTLDTGEPYVSSDTVERRADTDAVEAYDWRIERVVMPDGSHGVVCYFYDLTERQRMEAELREGRARDKAELEAAVRERTRELEAAQARLAHVQRMEALGQLAGGIAHDFNNVLQAVQGGAGLIERRPADPDGVRRLARMVSDAAGRGASITRRLLAFSRRGDLRSEAVDPVALLADLREILTHTLGAGVGVRVDAPPGLPALLADKGQLETVLVNMAANARDAMDGAGVLILAASAEALPKAAPPAPQAELPAGAYVRLCVSDTGAGMAPEVLARVTEPFFTTKAQGQGTGLGLAMARGFIEQSGGGLLIESAPGRGTAIHIWLPVAGAPSAIAEPGAAVRRLGGAARLLVVDDEPLVREVIARQLEAAGHDVVSVGDPREALALLDAGEPVDLIVSDLSMPGMDGVALVREANRRRPRLPAILLTGFATNAAEIAVSGAVSGLFSLLRKPVTERELSERVAMLLEGASGASGASPADAPRAIG